MSVLIPMFDKTRSKPSKMARATEEIDGGAFDVNTFVENFEVLAEATGGAGWLRALVLDLAVRGRVAAGAVDEVDDLKGLLACERSRLVSEKRLQRRMYEEVVPPAISLPLHWTWVRLGDIVRDCGQTVPSERFTYVDVSSVDNVRGMLLGDLTVLEPYEAPSRARKLVERGSVIYSTVRPYLLNVAVIDRPISPSPIVSTAFAVLKPLAGIEPRYLYWVLRSPLFIAYVSDQMKGVAYPAISDRQLYSAWVPLPPLAEQKRIVDKVDELMRLIDELEAKQTKKRETQARLRTAALDALTSAEGPEEFEAAWKRVAENFGALFERAESASVLRDLILEMAFTGRLVSRVSGDDDSNDLVRGIDAAWQERKRKEGLPEVDADEIPRSPSRWAWKRLGDLAAIVGGVTKGRDLRGRTVKPYPYLRVANVQRGFLDLRVMKEIEIPADELSKYRLESGDVLFTEGGDWDKLGRSSVWRGELDPCIHQNHVFRARLVFADLDPAWVSLFANSPLGRRYFENAAKQTTNLASINMTQLRHCPIPLPPLAEKRRIVAKVERLLKLCDELEAKLRRAEYTAAKLVEAVVTEMVA